MLRKSLEFIAQVAVISVCAERDASANAGVQVPRMPPPLLERVAFEEFLIKLPAHLRNDDLLGIRGIFYRNTLLRQPRLHFLRGGSSTNKLLESVEINWEAPVSAFGVGEDFVIDGMPFRELREVFTNPRRIRPEIMWSVGVNEHTMRVVLIISVAANMVALVHNQAALAQLSSQPLRHGQAGKPGTYDQEVEHFLDRMTGWAGETGEVFRQN